jgi:hypothetical protein
MEIDQNFSINKSYPTLNTRIWFWYDSIYDVRQHKRTTKSINGVKGILYTV